MYDPLNDLPTHTLRSLRDEAMTQAPEWRDVGKRAEQIMQQREAENNERRADD